MCQYLTLIVGHLEVPASAVIYTCFALVIDSSRSFTSFAINDRMISVIV
jgi:hypothetical protein